MRDRHTVHLARGSQLRAWVEAEPAKPEDEHTQCSHRQVMTRNSTTLALLRIFADTGTKCHRTNQGQHTTHAMHDGRACKIVEHVAKRLHHKAVGSIAAKPSAAPRPVTFDGIDDQRDHGAVNQIHRELCTLSHRTADDSGRGGTEDGLKDQETLYRQITFVETQVTPVRHADETA